MGKDRSRALTNRNSKYIYLLALLPFLFLVVMYELLPLIMLVVDSFGVDKKPDIRFSLENYQKIFTTLSYKTAILNSLRITLISTAVGIVIAFLGARAAYNSRGKFRQVFMTILNMTSNFAGVPLAFAYMIILGNAGVIKQIANVYGIGFIQNFDLYSRSGLTLMYIYFQIPLSTLLLIPAFNGIRTEWNEANMLLGGNNLHFCKRVAEGHYDSWAASFFSAKDLSRAKGDRRVQRDITSGVTAVALEDICYEVKTITETEEEEEDEDGIDLSQIPFASEMGMEPEEEVEEEGEDEDEPDEDVLDIEAETPSQLLFVMKRVFPNTDPLRILAEYNELVRSDWYDSYEPFANRKAFTALLTRLVHTGHKPVKQSACPDGYALLFTWDNEDLLTLMSMGDEAIEFITRDDDIGY